MPKSHILPRAGRSDLAGSANSTPYRREKPDASVRISAHLNVVTPHGKNKIPKFSIHPIFPHSKTSPLPTLPRVLVPSVTGRGLHPRGYERHPSQVFTSARDWMCRRDNLPPGHTARAPCLRYCRAERGNLYRYDWGKRDRPAWSGRYLPSARLTLDSRPFHHLHSHAS